MRFVLAVVALIAMPPLDGAVEDRVDVLEVNHVYDENANLVLSQLIGWDWSERDAAFRVRFWRLYRQQMQPQRQWHSGEWMSVFNDGDSLRRIRAQTLWTRWLQYDIELQDRHYLPQDRRRPLTRGYEAQTAP